jgi:class 3 adenylate cyclase
MNKKTHAILLVADISGYTQFMNMHKVSMNHAMQIVVRLLKSLIKASAAPLEVAQLEGDAVFFYAPCSENDVGKTAELVKKQLIELHNSFTKELELMRNMNVCNCDACTRTGDLRLKQIVHAGEVDVEIINNFKQIFGLAVIVLHRLLKNSVPSHQYILMTEVAYSSLPDFYGQRPELHKERVEGIGEVNTVVFYPENILQHPEFDKPERIVPSFIERLRWFVKLMTCTILGRSGLIKIRGKFDDIPF